MKLICTLVTCAILAAACCASAAAATYDSVLTGPLGDIPLHAEATLSDGIWTYTYTANLSGLADPVTGFTVGNVHASEFAAASNSADFVNPTFTGSDSVLWLNGYVEPAAGSVVFSYQSAHGPGLVNVTMWGGPAFPSGGQTLGMAPEPSSIIALALGLVGGLGSLRAARRRKT